MLHTIAASEVLTRIMQAAQVARVEQPLLRLQEAQAKEGVQAVVVLLL
jgi:hypothetical protein